jgi:hypothetical protein
MLIVLGLQCALAWSLWPETPPVVAESAPASAIEAAADRLMADAERFVMGGEAKRHQVYAALIKQFPTTAKRDLAYAIERVMQQRPRG